MTTTALQSLFEPTFYRFEDGYWTTNLADDERLEAFLISNIRLDSHDLNQHVRRILLDIHFARKQQLIGALQDLFVATGNGALPIKKNLLARSRTLLTDEELSNFDLTLHHVGSFNGNKSQYSYLN